MATTIPPTTRTTPEVGVYPGIPDHVYHRQWEAASNSRLTHLMRSPAHMLEYIANPPADTKATLCGRAIHAAILEPDLFESQYVRNVEGRTKAVQAARAELALRYGPDKILMPGDYDMCLAVRDSVYAHPAAKRLITESAAKELSVVWDEEHGVRCKGRFDGHAPSLAGGTIVDVKSTTDASREAFERSIFNFGYHRQAALYLRAAKALGLAAENFCIIAVEKEPPYAVAVYRITEGAVDLGWEQVQRALATYASCAATGQYPAYSTQIEDIALPSWSYAKVDAQLGGGA